MKKKEKGDAMNTKGKITEKDIQIAIRGFRTNGGLIKKLPDEIIPPAILVGGHLGMYERPTEYLYGVSTDF